MPFVGIAKALVFPLLFARRKRRRYLHNQILKDSIIALKENTGRSKDKDDYDTRLRG